MREGLEWSSAEIRNAMKFDHSIATLLQSAPHVVNQI